jgi:hypothetical protein
MSAPILTSFDPETIALMRSVLKQAVAGLPAHHRTPANQTAVASRILAAAAAGHKSQQLLLAAALDEISSLRQMTSNVKAA